MENLKIDRNWTLFLDRDGVVNVKRENDYVKTTDEFVFTEGAEKAIADLNKLFGRTLIVTNQQGIGKGIMTEDDLKEIHDFMQDALKEENAKIDHYYHCPDLASKNTKFRKPNTGMAEQARKDFPEIDFKKSVMVGDSLTDMQMGRRLGMFNVFISDKKHLREADLIVGSLSEFAALLLKNQ